LSFLSLPYIRFFQPAPLVNKTDHIIYDMYTRVRLFLALVAWAHNVIAETSLYIPGFDPQPVTANELGVGADGATTWLIAPGQPSGTLSDLGFYGPATLVLGPSGANLVYNAPELDVYMSEQCTFDGGLAVCSDLFIQTGFTTMDTVETETVQPFAVQTGGPAPATGGYISFGTTFYGGAQPTQTGFPPSSGSGVATPGGTVQITAGAAASPAGSAQGSAGSPSSSAPSGLTTSSPSVSSTSNPPAPTHTTNGAVGTGISSKFFLGVVGLVITALLIR